MWNFEKIPSLISEGRHILVNGEEYIGTANGWRPVAKPVPVKKEEKTDEKRSEVKEDIPIPEEKPVAKKSARKKKGDVNA